MASCVLTAVVGAAAPRGRAKPRRRPRGAAAAGWRAASFAPVAQQALVFITSEVHDPFATTARTTR